MNDVILQQDGSQIKSLIQISAVSINDEAIQTVNARDLHSFLGIKSQFRDWIRNRINEYDFQSNVDYILSAKILANGVEKKDYFITLDMAKELSMVERNAKGKEARQYFIDCEKKAKGINKMPSDTGLPEYRKAKAIEMATNAIGKIFSDLPHLSGISKQAIYANTINPIAGTTVIPLPVIEEKTYSATEAAEMLNTTAHKIGRIANRLEIKNSEYGHFVLDKSRHSSKQVETFRYNQNGIDALAKELKNIN